MAIPPSPPPPILVPSAIPVRIIKKEKSDSQQERILLLLDVHSYLEPLSKILSKSSSLHFSGQQMKDIISLHQKLLDYYQEWKQQRNGIDKIVDTLNDLKSKLDTTAEDVKELDEEAYTAKFKIGPQSMKMLKSVMKTPDSLQGIVNCYFKYNAGTSLSVADLIEWMTNVSNKPEAYTKSTIQLVDSVIETMGGKSLFKENMISHFKNFYKTDIVPDYLIQNKQDHVSVEQLVQDNFGSFQTMWKFACTVKYCEYDEVYQDAIAFLFIYSKFTALEWDYISTEEWYSPRVRKDFETGKSCCAQVVQHYYRHVLNPKYHSSIL
ncbi:hypothetical protein HDV06_000408 [Boothiomyces sp. JEL0866]|nr:hypothetical protein HDV06_000408 [Boothiomyces sp. JEL0866]